VPASSLYSSIPSQTTADPSSQVPSSYGSIDYGAFSQPPEAIPSYASGVPGQDSQYSYMYGGESGLYQMNEPSHTQSQLPGKSYLNYLINSTDNSVLELVNF
jgi:hypothetical protein